MESAKVYPLNRNRFERSTAVSAPVTPPKPKLLDQVRQAIRTRHYSPRTEETYIHWIKRFIFFHNKRHPAEMAEPEIARFLSSLATESHVSASTQNQALNAVLFLYRQVLRKDIGYVNGVVRANRPKRLPTVLTREEVRSIFRNLGGLEWIMAMLLYGAGLRLMECLQLRVKDVDFSKTEIRVRSGKGDKDRVTMLPGAVKEPLLTHLQKSNDNTRKMFKRVWVASPCPTRWNANIQTQGKSGAGSGYFPHPAITPNESLGRNGGTIFTKRYCRRQSKTLSGERESRSRRVPTLFVILLRLISWKTGMTFALSKNSSATPMSAQQWCTHTS
jgi:site-specific recombinase XerC